MPRQPYVNIKDSRQAPFRLPTKIRQRILQTVVVLTGSEKNNVREKSHPEYYDTENRVSKEPLKYRIQLPRSSLTRPDNPSLKPASTHYGISNKHRKLQDNNRQDIHFGF